MPHLYGPEHEASAASTFATHQPGAGVVADDVEGDHLHASEANEQFADVPARNAGKDGPDRPGVKPVRERSDDERQAAAGVPLSYGVGRKGEATRKAVAERQGGQSQSSGKPVSSATPSAQESSSKSSGSSSKSSSGSSSSK